MSMSRRAVLRACLALGAPSLPAARAADWPSRPLRLLVVYPPGGVSDVMARALAGPLADALGQPVVVEHRAGAGGSVGLDVLARASADGYTLAFSAISPIALHPLVAPAALSDRVQAVVPVAGVMRTPVLVVATPAFNGHDFADVLIQAQHAGGRLRWATSGVATTGHLVLAQVRALAGVDITHVPYQGGGQQLNDALAGHFELLSTNVAAQQLRYIEGGRLRALAVGAPQRLAALPQVPTLAELGFEAANRDSLFGIFAPPGTPASVVGRLNAEVRRIVASAPMRDYLRRSYNLPAAGSAEALAREIALERERNGQLLAREPRAFE
ncbi:tripartite tricarboxylate transporter substrate binding protein [Variovorax dokdonensis]|uniref:Tripartite tricarboxylate transporter substrate binding protein n=1 Tax=Variovorax dokdonensis TaxID=344883 RepID=A0ABT7N5S1_9BURK|nr:tripartite tricarboxylate transporter substrate binding protein [Variovorax dokdonensis]MDM0043275.1 tripartite tricarboxylate transporter substrate binding protein [Variovorax dokdonensis]